MSHNKNPSSLLKLYILKRPGAPSLGVGLTICWWFPLLEVLCLHIIQGDLSLTNVTVRSYVGGWMGTKHLKYVLRSKSQHIFPKIFFSLFSLKSPWREIKYQGDKNCWKNICGWFGGQGKKKTNTTLWSVPQRNTWRDPLILWKDTKCWENELKVHRIA